MCKEIFMTERMQYLETIKGLTVAQAYAQAKFEWEAQKGNSSITNYEEIHDDRDEEENNG